MQQLCCFLQNDVQVEQIERSQSLLTSIEPISYYRGKSIIAHLENDRENALKYLQKVKDITEQNEALYGFFRAEKTLTNLVEEKIFTNGK